MSQYHSQKKRTFTIMLVTLCEILGCAFVGKREKCQSMWRVTYIKTWKNRGTHLGPIFALEYK